MERICPQCELRTTEKSCPNDGFRTVAATRFAIDGRDPLVGTVFQERYRIEERIGGGGMGSVYRAEQLVVGRAVAVKILHGRLMDDLKEIARFQQEARIVASLKHPNTIQLVDFGETDDCDGLFLVTELLEGEPLGELIAREAPLAAERAASITIQILRALVEAHQRGIVHRDLKPHNIFIGQMAGQPDFVKVLDFGIAKVSATSELSLTATGVAVGSPRYMSPEQARAKRVSGKSDLYSLGCVLWEMLTGRPLFHFKTPTEYVQAHVKVDPPRPSVDGEELSGPLVDFVMRCLAKSPAERPAGSAAALAELEGMQAGPLLERERQAAQPRTAALPPGRAPNEATRRAAKAVGPPRRRTVPLLERVSDEGFVDLTASKAAPAGDEPDDAGEPLPATVTISAEEAAAYATSDGQGVDEAGEPLPETVAMALQERLPAPGKGPAGTLPLTDAVDPEAAAAAEQKWVSAARESAGATAVTPRTKPQAEPPASRTWLWIAIGLAGGIAAAVVVLLATG